MTTSHSSSVQVCHRIETSNMHTLDSLTANITPLNSCILGCSLYLDGQTLAIWTHGVHIAKLK